MKKISSLVLGIIFSLPQILSAQSIDYSRSWIGATFGGPDYGGSFIDKMAVEPDGTVHTFSGWDEIAGGGRYCTYKDGKLLNHTGFNIPNNTQVTDNNNKTWTILNPQNYAYLPGNDTIKCSDGRVITDAQGPRALAIANNGQLMVGEFGPNSQIRFYDISGTPSLDHTFGEKMGIFSGDVPGQYGPLRFRNIKGVAQDGDGNIYVAMSNFYGGSKLQSYKPNGTKNWEVNGLIFVDNASIDPNTDGNDVYTKFGHYKIDFSKPAGQQWTDTAYTMDINKYPDDPRFHSTTNNPTVTVHPSSTWIRYKNGKKFMIVNDMFSEKIRWYRFDNQNGEIAVPAAYYAQNNVKPWAGNIRYIKFNNDSINLLTDINNYTTDSTFCENEGINQTDSWQAFCDVDFGNTGSSNFTVSYSCVDPWLPALIVLHADSLSGRVIGSIQCTKTGGNQKYQIFKTNLDTITGVHKIYMARKSNDPLGVWPTTQPVSGDWLWADKNGNGQMDLGEYQRQSPPANMSAQSFWVDNKLDFWILTKNDFKKIPCTGINAFGNPIYDRNATISMPAPAMLLGSDHRGVFEYNSDSDIMYVLGKTQAARYSKWSTNQSTPDWVKTVRGNQSLSTAGDYLFVIDAVPGSSKIYVYTLSEGKYVGNLAPIGAAGLIDIPYGVNTFKRSNGEYVVLAEEDYLGFVRMYRFTNLLPNTPPVVNITKPTADQKIVNTFLFTAVATDPDGVVSKVQLFIDSIKVADTRTYTWTNATLGKHTIFAKAFDDYGDSTKSDIIPFEIIPTGILSLTTNKDFQVYPNPATDKVYIKMSDKITGSKDMFSVIDLSGRVISLKNKPVLNGNIAEIDLSGIAEGIYVIRVYNGTKLENLKLEIHK